MKTTLIVLTLFMVSCTSPLKRPAQNFLDLIGTEYLAYVRADPDFDADDIQAREAHFTTFQAAVAAAPGGE